MDEFPRHFGQYVLLKPLARGGMGALYLAVSGGKGMEKLCVIKTVLPHLADKEYLQRFRDEAKVVVKLSHGNLVPVFAAGQIEGELYLAMDFVEGRDLRATWNRCAQKGIAFPIDVAAYVVKELARGLGYAHAFGGLKLVHRDVSPPNLLLSFSGEVKLTDFGLASSTLKLEKTAPGVVYGKVSYMAPEQARGEALDGRTDVFAAGIMLWELLTGRQLFPTAAAAPGAEALPQDELLKKVRAPQIDAPSKRASRVPAELDRIALKALAPHLTDRYQTGEELRADLAAFLAKTAPSTDTDRVASFLRELFGADIETDRSERERLIAAGAAFAEAPPPKTTTPSPVASLAEARERRRTGDGSALAGPAAGDPGASVSAAVAQATDASSGVIGTLIGDRYQVLRIIGEGGMGRVYEAEHVEIGKRVALKILNPVYTRAPDVVERFRREARAASKIGHPNIVDVTDSGITADGSFYFVMEYLEGVELKALIDREGPLPAARALGIAAQICRALQAAHDAGVIHRNLKPENVLLIDREGQADFAKVLDFGIAKSAEIEEDRGQGRRLTHPGMTMGTPEYMAPEQAAGKPADPRSDIYAAGAILYEMLSGRPPYEGQNFMEILHKKANEAPRPLREARPDLPPEVETLVMQAMAREPEDRPQTMDVFKAQIQEIAARFGSGGHPLLRTSVNVDVPGFARRPAGRRRVLLGAATLIGGGLVAVLLASRAPAPPPVDLGPAPAAPAVAPVVAVPPPLPSEPPAAALPAPSVAPEAVVPVVEPPGEGPARAGPTRRRPRGGVAPVAPVSTDPGEKSLGEGQQMLAASRFGEAKGAFRKAAETPRLRGAAYLGLAQIAFQELAYDQAARHARRALKAKAGARAHDLLGDALFRLEKYVGAMREWEAVLKLEPGNLGARRKIAVAKKRM